MLVILVITSNSAVRSCLNECGSDRGIMIISFVRPVIEMDFLTAFYRKRIVRAFYSDLTLFPPLYTFRWQLVHMNRFWLIQGNFIPYGLYSMNVFIATILKSFFFSCVVTGRLLVSIQPIEMIKLAFSGHTVFHSFDSIAGCPHRPLRFITSCCIVTFSVLLI